MKQFEHMSDRSNKLSRKAFIFALITTILMRIVSYRSKRNADQTPTNTSVSGSSSTSP